MQLKLKTLHFVFVLTLILTILHTWPAVLSFNSKIIGEQSDGLRTIWEAWFFNKSISEGTSIYSTKQVAYPFEYEIFNAPVCIMCNILSILIAPLFNYIFAYNAIIFLSFILSGVGMFLFVRYLTKNDYASIIASIIFNFSAPHLKHARIHLGISNIQWFPFFALYLEKLIREPNYKNGFLASLFLLFNFLTYPHYGMYAGFYMGLRLVYELISKSYKEGRVVLKKKAIYSWFVFLVFSGITIPLFMSPFFNYSESRKWAEANVNYYSIRLINYFIPTALHSIWGKFFEKTGLTVNDYGVETAPYLGIINIVLMLIFIFNIIKKRTIKSFTVFFYLSGLFFMILSFGNEIRFFNLIIPSLGKLFYLFLPFYSASRTPERFKFMVSLCFCVASGLVLNDIFEKYKKKRNLILTILVLISFIDSMMIPFPMVNTDIPNYYNVIKNDTDKFAILDIPSFQTGVGLNALYMYYQTLHNKPIMAAYAAYPTYDFENFIFNSPLKYFRLDYFSDYDTLPLNEISKDTTDLLKELNVKYVIYHDRDDLDITYDFKISYYNFVKQVMNKTSIYKDDKIEVWQVY